MRREHAAWALGRWQAPVPVWAWVLACAIAIVIPTGAASAREPGGEREALARERSRLQARFAAEEAACRDRFAVNACRDEVRERRREALEPLRERELALDEADRRERAAERRRAIRARQEEAARRPPPPTESRLRPRELAPAASRAMPARTPPDRRTRESEAAGRAAAAERRREDALATQERIEQRQREREAAGRTALPLPLPGSAPAR